MYFHHGCDRSTPNKLRRLLPTSSALRLVHLDDGQRLRSQVALMDVLPDTTEPEHAESQDDWAAGDRPSHPRAFEPLRADNFTGRLGDPAANGHVLASVGLLAHPTPALFEARIG